MHKGTDISHWSVKIRSSPCMLDLTLTIPITTAADNTIFYIFFDFGENIKCKTTSRISLQLSAGSRFKRFLNEKMTSAENFE